MLKLDEVSEEEKQKFGEELDKRLLSPVLSDKNIDLSRDELNEE